MISAAPCMIDEVPNLTHTTASAPNRSASSIIRSVAISIMQGAAEIMAYGTAVKFR